MFGVTEEGFKINLQYTLLLLILRDISELLEVLEFTIHFATINTGLSFLVIIQIIIIYNTLCYY